MVRLCEISSIAANPNLFLSAIDLFKRLPTQCHAYISLFELTPFAGLLEVESHSSQMVDLPSMHPEITRLAAVSPFPSQFVFSILDRFGVQLLELFTACVGARDDLPKALVRACLAFARERVLVSGSSPATLSDDAGTGGTLSQLNAPELATAWHEDALSVPARTLAHAHAHSTLMRLLFVAFPGACANAATLLCVFPAVCLM